MAGIIGQDFIDEVLNRVDIVELIDGYIPLRKAGTSYVCCCPFHQEKTPSFNVIPHKQFFYCFGCGASGNAIKFLMQHLHLSFPESIKHLAESIGLTIPEQTQSLPSTIDLQKLLESIHAFYRKTLNTKPPAVIQYIKSRQLNQDMVNSFQLGYAPSQWQTLEQTFPHQTERLLEAGMLVAKDTQKHYDRFRDRLMFPLHNRQGKLIGFAGRVIDASQKPKYMNSPETPLFHKQKELYGLHQVLAKQQNPDFILVVEGYLDVISLFQFGLPNAVATMGTATSTYHLHVLNKYTPKIIFCFDGDEAGKNAAWRALENCIPLYNQMGQIQFLFLPEQHDPDSYIREFGKEGFVKAMENAISLHSYFSNEIIKNYGKQGSQRLIQELRKSLENLEDGPGKELIIEEIARRTRLDPFRINQWLKSESHQMAQNHLQATQHSSPLRLGLALILQHPALLQHLAVTHLNQPLPEPLNLMMQTLYDSPQLTTAGLVERFHQTPYYETFNQLVHFEHQIQPERQVQTLKEIFEFLNKQNLNDQIDELLSKLKREGLDDVQKKQLQYLLQKRHVQAN